MTAHGLLKGRAHTRGGFTLAELLVAIAVMGILSYATSMIYFSVLHIHDDYIWRLAPYDEATAGVTRLTDELREAMLIEFHGPDCLIVTLPEKDGDGSYLLTAGEGGYTLSGGDSVAFYLSDETGSTGAEGNCLWKAVKGRGETAFTPRIKLADDIHPELNPIAPETGEPEPMFTYWPDAVRLWGVEIWVTSVAVVRGEARTQTAHSEVYLRNL